MSVAYVFVHVLPEVAEARELLKRHQRNQREQGGRAPNAGVFWVHTTSFAIYNVLFG